MTVEPKTYLVRDTGCEKGDILVGAARKTKKRPANRGMKIRVLCAQDKGDNLQIEGGFELLEAGDGKYGPAMAEFVGRRFNNAQELVELVKQKPGANECKYILHKDMLQVEALTELLTGTEFPEGKQAERRHKAKERSQARTRQEGLSPETKVGEQKTMAHGLVKTDPPARTDRKGVSTHTFRTRLVPDWSEIEKQNRVLGRAGEKLVLDYEKKCLCEAGRGDLADRVAHVSEVEGDGAGFDIHSFTTAGDSKFIEVKTTARPKETPFYMSSNEVAFAKAKQKQFYLYRLYDYSESSQSNVFLYAPETPRIRLN